MTKGYLMNNLIDKMESPDQDFRYMGLNDLMSEVKNDPNAFIGDESVENRVIGQVLLLVKDKISEVKNQAVKCLGQLIKIIKPHQMETVIDKLIEYSSGPSQSTRDKKDEEELRDISGLALKTICTETPPDPTSKIALGLCAKLTPKVLGVLQKADAPPESVIESLSVLTILVQRFSTILAAHPPSGPEALGVLIPLLSHSRPVVRKRAILAISHFSPISPPEAFTNLLDGPIMPQLSPQVNTEKQKTAVNLVAALARQSPMQIAPFVEGIIPKVIDLIAKSGEDGELKDGGIQALEVLVIRCPSETNPWLEKILAVGTREIKYDPNYASNDDDDDESMADPDDDDDDGADLDDEYSDDEDTSYKIRRSATKLLSAIIATRPEMLSTLYRDVSPVLISRFGEREETVRLEVWGTYGVLLKQTALYGASASSKTTSLGGGVKRKRDADGTEEGSSMDVDSATLAPGSPLAQLKAQLVPLTKALFSRLKSSKTPPAQLQAAFDLLNSLLHVLPSAMNTQVPQVLDLCVKRVLSGTSGGAGSSLQLGCLSFLQILFSGCDTRSVAPSLDGEIMDILVKVANEKHPRVAAEAMRMFSALLNTLKPITTPTPWIDRIYAAAVSRVKTHDTDADVRSASEEVIADLWICARPLVQNQGGTEWDAICSRSTSVKVVVRVAENVEKGGMGDQWVRGVLDWLLGLLKKEGSVAGGKGGKAELFGAVNALLRSYSSTIPSTLPSTLIPILKPYLMPAPQPAASVAPDFPDPTLFPPTFLTLTQLLLSSPKITFPSIESDRVLMNSVYKIACSPLLVGSGMDAMLGFLEALVQADNQIANHLVPSLVGYAIPGSGVGTTISAKTAPGEVSLPNVAKCIGIVIRTDQSVAAGVIREYSKYLKKSSQSDPQMVVVSLLIMGELGRFIDMSPQQDIFTIVTSFLSASPPSLSPSSPSRVVGEEEVRAAASVAAGGITIGNLHVFLPAIIKMVKSSERKVRTGGLGAVREIVTHTSHGQLEGVADQLWVPLFEDSEHMADESTRNVASACLGKLASTQPGKYLPLLHAKVRDPRPETRATVVSAIRYTFTDTNTSRSLDELLAPLIVDFLSLMMDTDLNVRRLAVSSLSSAARTKPHLIRDHLSSVLPALYKESEVNKELIRTVQMGPWTHKVDDGLDNRKTAFEAMYTLIDTCLASIDLSSFLPRVIVGLSDDSDEIKVISHMLLFRLSTISPIALIPYLDDLVEPLDKTVKGVNVTKDTVKQDLERGAELQRSAARAVKALAKVGQGQQGVTVGGGKWEAFVDEVKRSGVWGAEV